MFGLFDKKKIEVYSPVKGKIIDIAAVEDAVFSAGMLGDGFAVEPEEGILVAPCDGRIEMLAATRHAVAIVQEGVQILLHVGLDTVDLKGQGFKALVAENDEVKCGEPLLAFDRDFIRAQGKKLTTMVVLSNMEEKVRKVSKDLAAEKILIVEVK